MSPQTLSVNACCPASNFLAWLACTSKMKPGLCLRRSTPPCCVSTSCRLASRCCNQWGTLSADSELSLSYEEEESEEESEEEDAGSNSEAFSDPDRDSSSLSGSRSICRRTAASSLSRSQPMLSLLKVNVCSFPPRSRRISSLEAGDRSQQEA